METHLVEYKQKWNDEFLKELCAFANAEGGTLFIGIKDNGEICGITDAKELLENLPNKINLTMGILPTIKLLEDNDRQYLQIQVEHSERPVSLRGRFYKRSGSTVQEVSGSQLSEFLLSKSNRQWDDFTCEGATLDDIDPKAIDYFLRCAIAIGNMPRAALNDSIETILANLNLLTQDNQLKNAAVLLFGKHPQRFFNGARFRIGRFMADGADLVRQDIIEGNIIQMADDVMAKLRADYLTSPIRFDGMRRIEQLEIPEDALRELVYNAIIHRDYLGADTQMKVFNDHIWCWNEGALPEGFDVEQMMKAHMSKPRNRLIASVFYKAGFVESWGRGIEKVCTAFKAANLPVPTFETFCGGTVMTIPRNNPNTESVDTTQKNVVENVADKLTERQQVILKIIRRFVADHVVEGVVDTGVEIPSALTIAKQIKTSSRTVQRELAYLQAQGIIRRIGGDFGGHWEVIDK